MGVRTELPDVIQAVAGGIAVAPRRAGNIYGIGTAVNSRDADRFVLCRSQELEREHVVI